MNLNFDDDEVCNKKYVDNIITDESLCTNTRHFDMKGHEYITNIDFLQINYDPAR